MCRLHFICFLCFVNSISIGCPQNLNLTLLFKDTVFVSNSVDISKNFNFEIGELSEKITEDNLYQILSGLAKLQPVHEKILVGRVHFFGGYLGGKEYLKKVHMIIKAGLKSGVDYFVFVVEGKDMFVMSKDNFQPCFFKQNSFTVDYCGTVQSVNVRKLNNKEENCLDALLVKLRKLSSNKNNE